jgi:hypothetical protein
VASASLRPWPWPRRPCLFPAMAMAAPSARARPPWTLLRVAAASSYRRRVDLLQGAGAEEGSRQAQGRGSATRCPHGGRDPPGTGRGSAAGRRGGGRCQVQAGLDLPLVTGRFTAVAGLTGLDRLRYRPVTNR